MHYVLLGPPASGKGTQGRRIATKYGLHYLSTGALLREAVENQTPLGLAAEPILDRGGYLPDDLISPILAEWLEEVSDSKGWVIDGFPRTIGQAKFLDQWLCDHDQILNSAIALEAPFESLIERTQGRVECPDCRWSGQRKELSESQCPECGGNAEPRSDDTEENFRCRHAEFVENTIPVIDFYRQTDRLVAVPAIGTREATTSIILSNLESRS
ncbi:MAG: adenylate kinase family protein [Akkermansiaceae bacterium]